jgi:hypothetical protein
VVFSPTLYFAGVVICMKKSVLNRKPKMPRKSAEIKSLVLSMKVLLEE